MRIKFILCIFAFLSIVAWGPFSYLFNALSFTKDINQLIGSKFWIEQTIQKIHAQADNLNIKVLKLSLVAYLKARELGMDKKEVLTVVDYSKPSDEKRLWVLDLKNSKVLYNVYVSHGKNSGLVTPTSFSNQPESLKSSLGVFVTDKTYFGGKGYSLRIKGLEPNINDNAYDRSIVFHGAAYVSPEIANSSGRVGRSFGCFAVSNQVVKPLIDTIKNDTVVFAYYPDQNWLQHSNFINT
jgi:hypothetical protein